LSRSLNATIAELGFRGFYDDRIQCKYAELGFTGFYDERIQCKQVILKSFHPINPNSE